jgi:CRP-like cAMP-binding protein
MPLPHELDVASELRALPGFRDLSGDVLADLVPFVVQKRALAQVAIVDQGTASNSWLALVRGAAKTTRTTRTETGKSVVVLEAMRAPCIVPDPSIFDGLEAPASIVTLRASHFFAVERSVFLRVVGAHPTLSAALLSWLAKDIRSHVRRIDEVVSGPVDERVKHLLESLALQHGTPLGSGRFIAIPLRRRDIACMVNATTETVSRLLAKFEREGLARSTRDGIWWRTAAKPASAPLDLGGHDDELQVSRPSISLPRDKSG